MVAAFSVAGCVCPPQPGMGSDLGRSTWVDVFLASLSSMYACTSSVFGLDGGRGFCCVSAESQLEDGS